MLKDVQGALAGITEDQVQGVERPIEAGCAYCYAPAC